MDAVRNDLIRFWRKLALLCSSGLPLLQALHAIAAEAEDARVKSVILALVEGVKGGRNLSDVAAGYPALFSPSVQSLLRMGESTGTLEKVCGDIAAGLENGSFPVGELGAADPAPEPVSSDDAESPVRLAGQMLVDAFRRRASDVHVESTSEGVRIRYRIDGVLQDAGCEVTDAMGQAFVSRLKIMAGLDVAERRLPQDGRMQVKIEGKALDIRVCCVPYVHGEGIVMRILSPAEPLRPLDRMCFEPGDLSRVKTWLERPVGLVIVTGPVGSGKTTTLYSLVDHIRGPSRKITSVEDPVEYLLDGVSQQAVRPAVGLTFAAALRAQLRQDADALFVGEIRDLETVSIIAQAVLVGKLVFTSLHTRDAVAAVTRLLDIGLEPFLLKSILTGIVAQRLVRRLCPDCRQPCGEPSEVIEEPASYEGATWYTSVGCEACSGTGYRGRIAIHEVLEPDDGFLGLVMKRAPEAELCAHARSAGIRSLRQTGFLHASRGTTTVAEVIRVTG